MLYLDKLTPSQALVLTGFRNKKTLTLPTVSFCLSTLKSRRGSRRGYTWLRTGVWSLYLHSFRACSCRTMRKGFKKKSLQLPGDSSGHLHLSCLSLPLSGSSCCCSWDPLGLLWGLWTAAVWQGFYPRPRLASQANALSIVAHYVSIALAIYALKGPWSFPFLFAGSLLKLENLHFIICLFKNCFWDRVWPEIIM